MEKTYYVFEYENEPADLVRDFDAFFALRLCANLGKLTEESAQSVFRLACTRLADTAFFRDVGYKIDNSLEGEYGFAFMSEECVRSIVTERFYPHDPDETVDYLNILHNEFLSKHSSCDEVRFLFIKTAFDAATRLKVRSSKDENRDREMYEAYITTEMPLKEIGKQIGARYGAVVSGDTVGKAAKDYHERHFPDKVFPKRKAGRKKKE